MLWSSRLSAVGAQRLVGGLGSCYLAIGAVRAGWRISDGVPLSNVVIVTSLIAVPGIILLYGAYWLPRSDIHPDFYPAVVGWVLAALGGMALILLVYHLQPADGISNPLTSLPILIGFASLAGFAVGTNNGRAKTRTKEVERRNRELQETQAELEAAVERLQASNERLEQFAYAASHDLQEPLRMISSYLQLIERRYEADLDADGREFLAFAIDGADRMRAMIDGLLAYSRVDTKGEPLEPVELSAVYEAAHRDLQVKIEESDATITAESLPRVRGDASQLRQVFQNLIDNAIEYSGDEPPRIHVFADRDGEQVTVAVQDQGIGIDLDDPTQVFEVFERGRSRSETAGSGIGLAICQRIVERHGGEMWVATEPGKGATFFFTLPTAEGEDDRPSGRRTSRRTAR